MRRPLFVVCLCVVTAAALRLAVHGSSDGELVLPDEGKEITVTGRICQKDVGSMDHNIFRIEVIQQSELSSAADSQQAFPENIKLICESREALPVRIGNTVTVKGVFKGFSPATNPGEFDAREYYADQRVYGKLTEVELLQVDATYSVIEEGLYRLRTYFRERLYHVFPEKEASVMTAMLLGDKSNLNEEIKKLYMDNGIIHILSISGLHITMIGMGVYKLLRRMGVSILFAALAGGGLLILYGVMTGMSVSACRAIGMYLIRMLGKIVGRTYDMLTALGVLAVCLVEQNPANLTNAGFLLSFGSIMGIGMLYPALQGGKEVAVPKMLRSMLASGSITLFTLPIQRWFYYEVSTYAILVNLLVLPLMGVVMCTGLIAMLVPGLGIVGTVTCFVLRGYERLCELFCQLPCRMWNPGRMQIWQLVIFYLFLGMIVWLGSKQKAALHKNNRKYAWKIVLLTMSVVVMMFPQAKRNVVTVLDVGQGDGILLETVSGEVFLFDCGSSDRKGVGEYVLIPFLKCRGIGYIDAVFVSHGDTDHCSGIIELLKLGSKEGITVGQLVLPAIKKEKREEEFGELMEAVVNAEEENTVVLSYVETGDYFETENASFLCLHPPLEYDVEDSNSYSQCIYVEVEGKKNKSVTFLFTGDVGGEGEELLVQELERFGIEDVTVLKVAHHGSRNSTSEKLVKAVNPKLAVISCGRNNGYGHPHGETMERLEDVGSMIMTTSESGAITIEMGEKVRVYGFCGE